MAQLQVQDAISTIWHETQDTILLWGFIDDDALIEVIVQHHRYVDNR
jgi:hypothetical protein